MKAREACLGVKLTWKDTNGVAMSLAMSGREGELQLSNETFASIIPCKQTREKALPENSTINLTFTRNISINSEDVTLIVNGKATQNKTLSMNRPNIVSLNGVTICIAAMLYC